MADIIRPFSDPIYIGNDRVGNHEELKQYLKQVYDVKKDGEEVKGFYANAFTSFFTDVDLINDNKFKPLQQLILHRAKILVRDQLEYTRDAYVEQIVAKPLVFKELWFNVNPPGAYQGKHHHADYLFGGTYYIQVPKNTGAIRFYNPNDFATFKLFSRSKNHLMNIHTDLVPSEGQLYLWPGFFDHEVTTNLTTDQIRISISFALDWA